MKKTEIDEKIKESGVKKTHISEKLGITRQGLEYHLKGGGDIDTEIEKKILSILSGDTNTATNTGSPESTVMAGKLRDVRNGNNTDWRELYYEQKEIITFLKEQLKECQSKLDKG